MSPAPEYRYRLGTLRSLAGRTVPVVRAQTRTGGTRGTWRSLLAKSGKGVEKDPQRARARILEDHDYLDLEDQVWMVEGERIAGWGTPRAAEKGHGSGSAARGPEAKSRIEDQVEACSEERRPWATPLARDGRSEAMSERRRREWAGRSEGVPLSRQVLGTTPSSSPARIEGTGGSGAALAPAFSLWLMGFPAAWLSYAPSGTRSSRSARHSGSGS